MFAGASASIVRTTTPFSIPLSKSRVLGLSPTDSIRMPSHGRAIFFPATNCWPISLARLLGIAKPRPRFNPLISVFIPMTLPSMSQSGPPEFPGLIEASVWM